MDAIGWLVLILIVLLGALIGFVGVQRRRRGGGVIATRDKL